MKVRILAIARKPQGWLAEVEKDFKKRIQNFAELEITLLAPADENSLAEKAKQVEAEKILVKTQSDDFVITCDLKGKNLDSEKFAEVLGQVRDNSKKIVFVIGGSTGLDQKILERADLQVSFSQMTFPHELFRVILLEQIYRACMILSGRKYHK